MYLVRAYSRNWGQHLILPKKDSFYEKKSTFYKTGDFLWKKGIYLKKGHQMFHPLYSIPFLSVLHQNKGLKKFLKRGPAFDGQTQYWTQYRSRIHPAGSIKCPYFNSITQPLWKDVNDWKNDVPVVPMIMSFKVWKYFSNGKISFFLFLCWNFFFFFFRNLDPHSSRCFSEKCWFLVWICLIWKLMEYTNDDSADASIISTF